MTETQAGWTTLREFNARVKARQEAQQMQWEMARWKIFHILHMMPFIKSHSKPRDVKAWIQFPWEKVREIKAEDCIVTEKEHEQLGRLLEAFKNRKR